MNLNKWLIYEEEDIYDFFSVQILHENGLVYLWLSSCNWIVAEYICEMEINPVGDFLCN